VHDPTLGVVLRVGTDSLIVDESVYRSQATPTSSPKWPWQPVPLRQAHFREALTVLTGRVLSVHDTGADVACPLAIYVAADTGDTMQLNVDYLLLLRLHGTLDSLAVGDSIIAVGVRVYSTLELRHLRRIQP
jgi:hypothetical protein